MELELSSDKEIMAELCRRYNHLILYASRNGNRNGERRILQWKQGYSLLNLGHCAMLQHQLVQEIDEETEALEPWEQ